jgi:hypothetical protein
MGIIISQSGDEIQNLNLIGYEQYPLDDEFVYFNPEEVDENKVFSAMVDAENGNSSQLFKLAGINIKTGLPFKNGFATTKSSSDSISNVAKMK